MIRWIAPLLLLLVAVGAFCLLHPSLRSALSVRIACWRGEADEHYRLAERFYQAADYARAEVECDQAIRIDPSHAPAQALRIEVRFVQGKGGATANSQIYGRYIEQAIPLVDHTLAAMELGIECGNRALSGDRPDEAEREFRKVLEYAKWLPTGIEVETRRKQAEAGLARCRR